MSPESCDLTGGKPVVFPMKTGRHHGQGGFGFDVALHLLKSGRSVSREGWNVKGMWIRINTQSQLERPDAPNILETHPPYIEMRTAQNTMVPWVPTQTDMLAEDWHDRGFPKSL